MKLIKITLLSFVIGSFIACGGQQATDNNSTPEKAEVETATKTVEQEVAEKAMNVETEITKTQEDIKNKKEELDEALNNL